MTLDTTKPSDQELISMLPYYIRENRASINEYLASDVQIVVTELEISAGDTALVVGTDLSAVSLEVILVTGSGAATITQIRGGTEGQLKIFIFQDNNISFTDGIKSNGQLYLNQLPVLSNFNAQVDDILVLFNVGGDGGADYGYWKELLRQLSVK